MGTLFHQDPRNHRPISLASIKSFVIDLQKVASETGADLSHVIATAKLMEYERRTNIMIDDADIWDEQISGFAQMIQDNL